MRVEISTAQDRGARKEQQDSFGLFDFSGEGGDESALLAVLADGMGGMAMGRECSELAVSAFIKSFAQRKEGAAIAEALKEALKSANSEVYHMADKAGVAEGTGSTLIAAVVQRHLLYWISVGDSHIYLFSEGKMTLLNEEHNVGGRLKKLAESGNISEEESKLYFGNMEALTSFIGISELSEIDSSQRPVMLKEKDVVLLCSDGLFKFVPEEEIVAILLKGGAEAAKELVKCAVDKKNPGQDNVTVTVICYKGEPKTVYIPRASSEKEKRRESGGIYSTLFGKYGTGK